MKEGLTQQERIAVTEEAIRLISRPDTFVEGEWKCPVFELPKTRERFPAITEDEVGGEISPLASRVPENAVQAQDKQGRPLFAYCVEGAINQAGINILGVERAKKLGATNGTIRYGEVEPAHNEAFADYLSINQLAAIMYADFFSVSPEEVKEHGWADTVGEPPAQAINDSGAGQLDWTKLDEFGKQRRAEAHGKIVGLLRRRVALLRKGK